jgi:hypothetical protein
MTGPSPAKTKLRRRFPVPWPPQDLPRRAGAKAPPGYPTPVRHHPNPGAGPASRSNLPWIPAFAFASAHQPSFLGGSAWGERDRQGIGSTRAWLLAIGPRRQSSGCKTSFSREDSRPKASMPCAAQHLGAVPNALTRKVASHGRDCYTAAADLSDRQWQKRLSIVLWIPSPGEARRCHLPQW